MVDANDSYIGSVLDQSHFEFQTVRMGPKIETETGPKLE